MNWKFCRVALSSPLHVLNGGGGVSAGIEDCLYLSFQPHQIRHGCTILFSSYVMLVCYTLLLHIFMLLALWLVVTNDRTAAHTSLWGGMVEEYWLNGCRGCGGTRITAKVPFRVPTEG